MAEKLKERIFEKTGISQIHIIPFDLGYLFYDILSVDNLKNLQFAQAFVDTLTDECKKDTGILVRSNISVQYSMKKVTKVGYLKTEIADEAICIAKLTSNLFCYILTNGIGVFVLADLDADAIAGIKDEVRPYSKAVTAYVQKRLSQTVILNGLKDCDILSQEKALMLTFRLKCWETIAKAASKYRIKPARPFSGDGKYKMDGLSYVLTAYIIKKGEMSEEEVNYLMYAPLPKRCYSVEYCELLQSGLDNRGSKLPETTVTTANSVIHFSWSAVAIITENDINSFDDIVSNPEVSALVRAEIYVQSKWFIADNSIDNVKKSYNCSLEELQRAESLIEFYQAELENEISANMNTLYKQVLEKVVQTSSVKSLYKSVIMQIRTQRKIKEAQAQDVKKRNSLFLSMFMAVFTASSLFKTINDIISNINSARNAAIFGAMLMLAIGTVLFDYYNK